MNCARCAAPVPDGARFCPSCGSPVAAARAAEGERRVVTVLFCDVKGSTTLAESLDPEEWSEIMHGAFDVLTAPIDRYEGTVARLMGDAVLAYFGFPHAHEDDPERAILAALDMNAALVEYRERLRAERGIADFDVRFGINTGLAVVSDAGGQGIEYGAMGDAVNVAARLQTAAPAGGILVGDSTQKRVADRFELRPLGALDVKGRSAPVEAFEVIARAVAPETPRTPLVDRVRELAELRNAARDVRSGRGRIVALVGDAGLGKSRLIDELRREWRAEGPDGSRGWSEARGQSYGGSRSYLLFRQHVLRWAGASDGEEPEAVRVKLDALIAAHVAGGTPAGGAALELLLGLRSEGDATLGERDADGVRRELFDLIGALARGRAAQSPAVLVFDDLQWSDPASVELLTRLFAIVDEVPVLFLLAFRPDRQSPAWRAKQAAESDFPHVYAELALAPLEAPEAEAVLRGVLGEAQLPSRVRERVLAKAEGNPLFLEEIVRSLVHEGVIQRTSAGEAWRVTRDEAEIRLPETLRGLLAARIDRLDEEVRRTLQAAAVIGPSFAYRVLRKIEETERLDRHLATLQRVELVRELGRDPERLYGFRHALTQEAAYGSILQRRRRQLHLRVAESLEELYADRRDEYAEQLGHHFAEAGDARAIAYLKQAGDRALALFALDGAISDYSRALALSETFPPSPDLLTDVHVARGRAYELASDFAAAVAEYEELERLGKRGADAAMELSGLAHLITVLATPTTRQDLPRAEALLERAIPLARGSEREDLLARVLWNRLLVAAWRGNDEQAIAAGEEAAVVARRARISDLLGYILSDLARRYQNANRAELAESAMSEAAGIFRASGNKPMLADLLGTMAFRHFSDGDYDAVLADSAEARRLSDETKNLWGQSFSGFMVGYVHTDRGDYGRAITSWEEAIGLGEQAGFLAIQVGPRADLAWCYRLAGGDERADFHIAVAHDVARQKLPSWLPWIIALRGRMAIARGQVEEARELLAHAAKLPKAGQIPVAAFNEAIGTVELHLAAGEYADAISASRAAAARQAEVRFRPYGADWKWYEGEALRLSGDPDAAIAAFAEADVLARGLGSRRMLWRILWSVAQAHAALGSAEAASRSRLEALGIIDHIAGSLDAVGLAEKFRALREVRALTEAAF
ncbi:MAG: AAA family ATPase [Candidatus Limnocylindria bacterium]